MLHTVGGGRLEDCVRNIESHELKTNHALESFLTRYFSYATEVWPSSGNMCSDTSLVCFLLLAEVEGKGFCEQIDIGMANGWTTDL
jgi:hypothetical protein